MNGNEIWYIYTMIVIDLQREVKLWDQKEKWVELKELILTEVSRIKKAKVTFFIYGC